MQTEENDFTDKRTLRLQAEKILQQKLAKAKLDLENETDAKKLLHELQVHQIELEMQNEELQNAYDTAEEALKKYTLVFDHAPMGFITLESNGTITELNFAAAEMLRDRRFSLVGSNFKLYVSDESKKSFDGFFAKVYISNKKESCHLLLDYDNDPLCHVYIEGFVIENDDKCLLSLIDISKFKSLCRDSKITK